MKRLLALLLVLCMAFSLLPMAVLAEEIDEPIVTPPDPVTLTDTSIQSDPPIPDPPEITTYTVTITVNAPGNGSYSITGAGSYAPGETVTLSAPATGMADNGKATRFDKWTGYAKGSAPSISFTMPEKDVQMTAHYKYQSGGEEEVKTYTVTYLDGADGTVFAPVVHSELPKDSATPAAPAVSERTGYTFTGWAPQIAATVTENATYVAQWAAKPVQVQLYVDGKFYGDVIHLSYGQVPALPSATEDGRTIHGWYLDSGYTAKYQNDPVTEQVLLLHGYTDPVDPAKHTIQLSYDANGGAGAPPAQTSGELVENEYFEFSVSSTEPTREGHTFLGWFTADGTKVGDTYTTDVSTTLYAHWEAKPVQVQLYVDGKFYGDVIHLSYGQVPTLPTATEDGRTIHGWYLDSGYTAKYQNDPVTEQVLLLHGYTDPVDPAKHTIQLSYDANGGAGAPPAQTSGELVENEYFEFTISSTEPTREGHTFLGWFTADGTKVGDTYTTDVSTTLYAHWEAEPVQVQLYVDGKFYGDVIHLSYGQVPTLPTATEDGRTIHGWYLDSGYTAKYQNDPVTEQVLLLHGYTDPVDPAKHTIQLSYDANGGTGIPLPQFSDELTDGEYFQFTVTAYEPTREGYTFLGWFTKADGGDKVGETYSCNVNTTLYAHWEEEEVVPVEKTIYLDYHGNAWGVKNVPDTEKQTSTGKDFFFRFDKGRGMYRKGYRFVGWSFDEEGNHFATSVRADYDDVEDGTVIHVYAQWEKDRHHHHGDPDESNPKTSDDSNIYLWVTVLALSTVALIGTTTYGLKKRR